MANALFIVLKDVVCLYVKEGKGVTSMCYM